MNGSFELVIDCCPGKDVRLPLYPTISLEEYPENGVEMSPQRKNGGGAGYCTRPRQVSVQVYPYKVEDTVDTVGRNVLGVSWCVWIG